MTMETEHPQRQWYEKVKSPVGELTIIVGEDGVRAILWENERPGRVKLAPLAHAPGAPPCLEETKKQLDEYFRGERTEFDLPLAPRGTDFQQRAWEELRRIPFGETRSYEAQAEALGSKNLARAVGAANGRNPLSIVVPCHRVVGKDGSMTGFATGVDRKRFLLQWESRRA